MNHACVVAVRASEPKREYATPALPWVHQLILRAIHPNRAIRVDLIRNERSESTSMPRSEESVPAPSTERERQHA